MKPDLYVFKTNLNGIYQDLRQMCVDHRLEKLTDGQTNLSVFHRHKNGWCGILKLNLSREQYSKIIFRMVNILAKIPWPSIYSNMLPNSPESYLYPVLAAFWV